MKISDLIEIGEETRLSHPVIGKVMWREDEKGELGWCLVFAEGPEQGRPLLADASVLFDERWSWENLNEKPFSG